MEISTLRGKAYNFRYLSSKTQWLMITKSEVTIKSYILAYSTGIAHRSEKQISNSGKDFFLKVKKLMKIKWLLNAKQINKINWEVQRN